MLNLTLKGLVRSNKSEMNWKSLRQPQNGILMREMKLWLIRRNFLTSMKMQRRDTHPSSLNLIVFKKITPNFKRFHDRSSKMSLICKPTTVNWKPKNELYRMKSKIPKMIWPRKRRTGKGNVQIWTKNFKIYWCTTKKWKTSAWRKCWFIRTNIKTTKLRLSKPISRLRCSLNAWLVMKWIEESVLKDSHPKNSPLWSNNNSPKILTSSSSNLSTNKIRWARCSQETRVMNSWITTMRKKKRRCSDDEDFNVCYSTNLQLILII